MDIYIYIWISTYIYTHTHTTSWLSIHLLMDTGHFDFMAVVNNAAMNGCSGLVPKLCLTLCDPVDCTPPGFSVDRISQARILE